jgi:hypothetical protein
MRKLLAAMSVFMLPACAQEFKIAVIGLVHSHPGDPFPR